MNLSLGFPEPAQERILARQSGLSGAIERFQQWMADPDLSGSGRPPPGRPAGRIRRVSGNAGAFSPKSPGLARNRPSLHAPGRSFLARRGRTQRRDRDAHRQRQDPVLQPAGAERAAGRSQRPRDVPVPDQGPRRGPVGRVSEGRGRDGVRSSRVYLRWRYAAGRAPGDSRARQRRLHQSGHAPLRASSRTTPSGPRRSRTCATW